MGFTKSSLFKKSHIDIATIAKVIGHPARIAIIEYISHKPETNCNAIVAHIGLAQSTVSQHLIEIKKSGILLQKGQGKNVFYSIDIEQLNLSRRLINDFFVKLQINSSK